MLRHRRYTEKVAFFLHSCILMPTLKTGLLAIVLAAMSPEYSRYDTEGPLDQNAAFGAWSERFFVLDFCIQHT